MKVYYQTALINRELVPGNTLRTLPCKALLKLCPEKNEGPYEMIYNETEIKSVKDEIECNEEGELIIRQGGERHLYAVRPLIKPLSTRYARVYDQFIYEYGNMESDEIDSIQHGRLKLYAVDQTTEVFDYSEIFGQIERAFRHFKLICEKPISHLKAVNEVRPIETVKRIGYESIPYLAAHSEDWLARTASGLKPARLFSRVEDDEFQIYENRVVKTLLDLILAFLRKTERQLRDQRDQLQGIIASNVQTDSFGFDASFRRAVSELMSSDNHGDEFRPKVLEQTRKMQISAYDLLKKYRGLRQSRLYRYLRNAKSVSNPLNETNILTMDKNYSVIFKLWKAVHRAIAPQMLEEGNPIPFDDIVDDYGQFCATLCGYAAHILGFELLKNGHYVRKIDRIDMTIVRDESGLITVRLKDIEPRSMAVPDNVEIPISAGNDKFRIAYDGHKLLWPADITEDEMDDFCALLKTKSGKGRGTSEGKRKYTMLKSLLDTANRSYADAKQTKFVIFPAAVELGTENQTAFRRVLEELIGEYRIQSPNAEIIVALPLCNEAEQNSTAYAREDGDLFSVLPLTMFDINSFRRLQNVLYRQILKLRKDSCPSCGGEMRINDNQRICDNCGGLTITETICPNPQCRHKYSYMSYSVDADTIKKMQSVKQGSFFEHDSLFQYKDIVNMAVISGKIRTICPCCHQNPDLS